MNILITGGSGLVGQVLVAQLTQSGHAVRILTRKNTANPTEFQWDLTKNYIDGKAFENLDAIIHLAGANISQRWSESYKKELFSSRVESAQLLKEYCVKHDVQLKAFISASGINYYGTFTSDRILTEKSGIIQTGFLTRLCEEWEAAANSFSEISNRVVCLRTAMVLAEDGGAYPLLKKVADFNLSSAIGSGTQWMNWIHAEDLAAMYVFALGNSAVSGAYNAVADEIPTNRVFMKKLASVNGKFFLPVNIPAFVMKSVFGEMSSIILEGTRAGNEKIKSLGFDFKYAKIEDAFQALIK